jgi:transposase
VIAGHAAVDRRSVDFITVGPRAADFVSACWTTSLAAELLRQHLGIEYHPHYLAELLHDLGFS